MKKILFIIFVSTAGILPVVGQTPSFGNSTFFSDVKAWMTTESKDVFLTKSGNTRITVFDADKYKMGTYTTSTVGDVIDDAVNANPNAEFIINGSMFNYAPRKAVTIPTLTPTGNIANGGTLIHDTSGTPSEKPAKLRYWVGQENDTSAANNAGSADSYKFGGKGHPTPIGLGGSDLGAAHGGLSSLIWEKGGSRHKQTNKDDSDLATYGGFKGGWMKGFGIIGVDRDTGLMFIAVKDNWSRGSIYDMQDELFDSGADRAVLVDGAGSIGYYNKQHSFFIKARRHENPSAEDTVPSYILFFKNE